MTWCSCHFIVTVEQELLTLPENLSSHPVFCGVCVVQSLVFLCSVLYNIIFPLSFFYWPSQSVLFLFTASDYPFGIFRLVLYHGIRFWCI